MARSITGKKVYKNLREGLTESMKQVKEDHKKTVAEMISNRQKEGAWQLKNKGSFGTKS